MRRVSLPARGKGSLALEIGATAHGVSVACDLTFREPTRFYTARRVVTYCWIDEGEYGICASCDEEISAKRLGVDPIIPTCIRCASGGSG